MKIHLINAWVLFWLLRISIEDIRRFTIPDLYTLAILTAAPFLFDIPFLSRLLAAALPFALIPLMGMGDVKLYSALGFSFGLQGLLKISCLSMLAGGIYAAMLLSMKRVKKKDKIAFGPFIAAAAAFVLLCPADRIGMSLLPGPL